MTQPERAKIIYAVICTPWKKSTEQAMLGKEGEYGSDEDNNNCHICDREGHKEKNVGIMMLLRLESKTEKKLKKR